MSESSIPHYKESGALQAITKAPERSNAVGYLAVVAAAAFWGTSGVFIKFIVDHSDFTALTLAFWRDLVTFAVLITGTSLLRPSILRVHRQDLRWLAALGCSLGILHVFWVLGVLLNGVAVATVQQATMPAILAVASWFFWREPLTGTKVLAIGLTFVGTVLASNLGILGQADLTLPGLLVGLALPFAYASWNMLGKKVRGQYGSLTVLTYAFGFGALVLLPGQILTPLPWPVSSVTGLWFAGLIGISTLIGFSFYTFGLGRLQASVAGILAMAEIPLAGVYAYLLLGERMTTDQILGTLLVIGGVLILSWRRERNASDSRTARL